LVLQHVGRFFTNSSGHPARKAVFSSLVRISIFFSPKSERNVKNCSQFWRPYCLIFSSASQVCQMVYFQTKKSQFG
jgi:hypothetical protein